MRSQLLLLGLALGVHGWEDWLRNFGHDTFVYPSWVAEQKADCDCSVDLASGGRLVSCSTRADGSTTTVEWRSAQDLDFCVAKHWLLEHMPDFDLHYLPPALSVDGDSMLDDNIAFALMALRASALDPEPPLEVRLGYILPYAAFHEARANWRPLFFAKFFDLAQGLTSTREMVTRLVQSTEFMNWTGHYWSDSPRSADDASYKVVWSSSTNPPVVAPFDMIAYGYGSCTAWATFLTSALKSVGVPARQVGSPCWNTGQFQGLASENPNVTECWTGGPPGDTGGAFLNNHNWVEWWDNEVQDWSFMDVPPGNAPSRDTWWCGGGWTPEAGCSCGSNGGRAMRDHPVLSATWDLAGEGAAVNGGEVLSMAELQLSSGQRASPLSWAPHLSSPLGRRLADVGLRMVNRTEAYRCKPQLRGLVDV